MERRITNPEEIAALNRSLLEAVEMALMETTDRQRAGSTLPHRQLGDVGGDARRSVIWPETAATGRASSWSSRLFRACSCAVY
jgi:hypothetical protein